MTTYRFPDIVLVVFTQPDGGRKQRPALVVLDVGDDDIVVAPITSRMRKGRGDLLIKNWQRAGLLAESRVRLSKIACIGKSDVGHLLGRLAADDSKSIISMWSELFKLA